MLAVKPKVEVSTLPKKILQKLINGGIFKPNEQYQNNMDYQPLTGA